MTPTSVLYTDPHLGRIFVPPALLRATSFAGAPTRRIRPGEVGVFVATQRRPVFRDDGRLERMELLWNSITHNERVDAGAAIQANLLFGTSGTTANGVLTAVAVASASITKTKTDLSLGSASASVTTNEYTTIGLSRAAGTVSTYTAPASLGAQFSQLITKAFTASGGGTAYGAGLFDSTTVSGSHLYVEDLFSSNAVLVSGDSLTVSITVSN